MASLDVKSLVLKLNTTCREALEAAAGLAVGQTHYAVEIEHWLVKMLETPSNDVAELLKAVGVDPAAVRTDIDASLEKMKRGNSATPPLAPGLVELVREAWLVADLKFSEPMIRSGHVLVALASSNALALRAATLSPRLASLDADRLIEAFAQLAEQNPSGEAADTPPPGKGGPLDTYCQDLTEQARAGKIDPVLGRDGEIRQMIDILLRRRQNNPIITGEAGVGKTAVVEGLARRISEGDVPDVLKDIRLLSLDLALLQAGAGVKGEFENRLKNVIQAVKDSPQPIIIFIDEAHTLIGAGGAEGQGDAANLIKPALARGEMKTIAATTWSEYKKYFEKDPALVRRFQVIDVKEPDVDTAVAIMRGVAPVLSAHHSVTILDEALVASVQLSKRYLPGRQLPDKSISLLDTAASRVSLSQSATPAGLEDAVRKLEVIEREVAGLQKEQAEGADHGARLTALEKRADEAKAEHAALSERWEKEKTAIAEISELRTALAEGKGDRAALKAKEEELNTLQGDEGLIFEAVNADVVAQVLAGWTGIPVGNMAADEIRSVMELSERMGERIKGQDFALNTISEAMRISAAKLADERKPQGVFMFFGTSGVGKTETALTLADEMFGGEQAITVINMSEFKEEHKVSMLMGAPPGYVGFGEGGVLTEAVRRRPYGVVLLDEMEKAHPGVQDVFYQAFDKGIMKDGQGRDIDCRNTVFIMTSNAATDIVEKLASDPETMPDADGIIEAARPELLKTFKPAFLGRVTLVPYVPLGEDVIRMIVDLTLNRLGRRIRAAYGAELTWSDEVADHIAASCTESQSGARNVETIVKRTLSPELASRFLSHSADGETVEHVTLSIDKDGLFGYTFKLREG